MLLKLAASLRPHYSTIVHLCLQGVTFQLAAGWFLCVLCWISGYPVFAVVAALGTGIGEWTIGRLVRRARPFQRVGRNGVILTALLLCVMNTLFYLLPAIVLAGAASLAVKVTALLWIMGVHIYVVNVWARVPIFMGAMVFPTLMSLGIALFQAATSPTLPSDLLDWSITGVFLIVFYYSAIDTLRNHIATEAALFEAREETRIKVAALETAQRTDPLTGVLNRAAFDRALSVMLEDAALTGDQITVFLADLDNFKPLNDTYSHDAGDCVLIETASRLSRCVGDAGVVARLGGDEFIFAVGGLGSADEAQAFALSCQAEIARPIRWSDHRLGITASIGFSRTGDERRSPAPNVSALCAAADQAMFAAKSAPSFAPVQYEKDAFAPRMSAEDKQALIEAIQSRDVVPYYQPKMDLQSGTIQGFEALARWHHPSGDVRNPDSFLDQIRDLGLQGDFMLRIAAHVLQDIADLLDEGLDPGQVSINLSEVALATRSGREDLETLISRHPEAARHVTFEITEDVFIARAAEMIQASIAGFRAYGIRISLDDFGTGFASFHHLRQLAFDELKIDASFIADLGQDETADVLVKGFLDIAKGLNVGVVAEGVETEAQARILIEMGCSQAQGFLYGGVVPISDARDLLRADQTASSPHPAAT